MPSAYAEPVRPMMVVVEIFEANKIEIGTFEFDIFNVVVTNPNAYHTQLIKYE